MLIDRDRVYTVGIYSYKNFVSLSKEEIKLVWEWRNHDKTRKWMINQNKITRENHLTFLGKLKIREDAFYWLMFRENKPIGVLSIVNVDYLRLECDPGYYLAPDLDGTGLGLEMHYHYKQLIFNYLGFDCLVSHILFGNTNAYQLSLFFGAEKEGEEHINGEKYVIVRTPKSRFNKIRREKLINQFVKFNRENPIKWE